MNQPPVIVAYYLPQFHPIPENDKAWGTGFTEWTNVKKALPLFRGHYQPRIPSLLGYYDLLDSSVQVQQSELAQSSGIGCFAYWYYWMGSGKRLLEKPLDNMISNKDVSIPFCLAWANQSWTGVWHGNPSRIIAKQEYSGKDEVRLHGQTLLSYMNDDRYFRLNGKPLLCVFDPGDMPGWYLSALRDELSKSGELIFAVAISNILIDWKRLGYDGLNLNTINAVRNGVSTSSSERIYWGLRRRIMPWNALRKIPYNSYTQFFRQNMALFSDEGLYPTCIPNWDNTPRSGRAGLVLLDSSPEAYADHLRDCILSTKGKVLDTPLVFIKSWNEWAEGNYLEPDERYGALYLDATKNIISTYG